MRIAAYLRRISLYAPSKGAEIPRRDGGRAPRQKTRSGRAALGFGVALKRRRELPSIAASLNSSVKLRFGDGRTFFT
jgi:hypothetical protein